MRRFWPIVATTTCIASAAPGITATAAGTTAVGSFTATLYFPTYPCDVGGCAGGTLTGLFTGTVAGTDVGPYYSVTWPDPTAPTTTNLTATFNYSEGCPLAQGGGGTGFFTITGGLVDDNGVIAHDGTMTGEFDEGRTGVVLTVSLAASSVSGHGHTLGTQQLLGVGGGVFAPLTVAACGQSPSASAAVAGVATIPT